MALLLLVGNPPAPATDTSTVTIYRCLDAKGRLSLQGDPCPKDSTQSTLNMVRPKDPPARSTAKPPALLPPPPANPPMAEGPYVYPPPPPPPLFECTSYDGIVRESEVYDPNPRCEPIALYLPNAQMLTPQQAGLCRWVEDSCVRLSDDETCARFVKKKREAASAVMHSFSDTATYRKSELQRLTQIVDESCP
jgi:hypothetical protein